MDGRPKRPPIEGFSPNRGGLGRGGEAWDEDDLVEGHIMGDERTDLEQDTEGHLRRPREDEDDTEGHLRRPREDDDDDTEGHLNRPRIGDDDDTEGHLNRPR